MRFIHLTDITIKPKHILLQVQLIKNSSVSKLLFFVIDITPFMMTEIKKY
jgi:hypothetical protein